MARHLATAFNALDINNLKASFPKFVAAVNALVHFYGHSSATIAADYYDAERKAAGISGKHSTAIHPPIAIGQLQKELNWATQGLWGSTETDDQAVRTLVQGVAEKAVLDAGRNTIFDAVQSDDQAVGWARVPEPDCCAFCALLATRGAVYKSKQSAGPNVRGPRNSNAGVAFIGDGDFKVHDHCRCHIEPLFGASYEPTAAVRGYQALYESSTKGKSGKDAINAFRRALGRN